MNLKQYRKQKYKCIYDFKHNLMCSFYNQLSHHFTHHFIYSFIHMFKYQLITLFTSSTINSII